MGRAIVRDPRLFLMDEPLSNLDAKLRVQMRTEVARIQQRLGTTTVYVTHDQTEAMTLGDRVAVMRGGIVQQVASPKVLYDDPVNLFVAGFIGSPAMNFLPGQLDGDTLRLPMGDVPIPAHLRGRLQQRSGDGGGRDVVVGVRPEHFEDAAIAGEAIKGLRFRAKVAVVESMGSELYAYFDVAGGGAASADLEELARDAHLEDLPKHGDSSSTVVARLDAASKATPNAEIDLVLQSEEIKLFDPQGGLSLTR
jgi:multiple sugar transport system ATP-binding protein